MVFALSAVASRFVKNVMAGNSACCAQAKEHSSQTVFVVNALCVEEMVFAVLVVVTKHSNAQRVMVMGKLSGNQGVRPVNIVAVQDRLKVS